MTLTITHRQVGPWQMNTYALICTETGESVLFDPGDDPDTLSEMVAGTTPVAIWLTHTHPDHIGALDEMRRRLKVPLVAFDAPHAGGLELDADRWVANGERVTVGRHSLRVDHAPGHIPDQICFFHAETPLCVVGDTVFDGGPGRTWSSAGFQETLQTLRNVVLAWPDDTMCYPGHGPAFRLGDRRAAIEAFLARDHGDFHGDAEWEMGT